MRPIFIAWTRSFWLSVFGVLIILFEAPREVLEGLAVPLAYFLPWDEYTIGSFLTKIAPAILWVMALHQRAGRTRPYTLDPTARE